MFYAMFGTLTGTLSTGMILLKQVDPMLETPAANNIALHSLPAIAYGFPIFFLIPFASKGVWQTFTVLGIVVVLFIVFNILMFKLPSKKNSSEVSTKSEV